MIVANTVDHMHCSLYCAWELYSLYLTTLVFDSNEEKLVSKAESNMFAFFQSPFFVTNTVQKTT